MVNKICVVVVLQSLVGFNRASSARPLSTGGRFLPGVWLNKKKPRCGVRPERVIFLRICEATMFRKIREGMQCLRLCVLKSGWVRKRLIF